MIQPNELRLLNWVKLNDEDLFCKVLVIDNFGLSVDIVKTKEITWIEYEQFSPVELTPDILEAAGCVYIDEIGAYYINGHSLFEFIDGIKFNIFSANDSDCYITIKYLHQLQNLYFALTGEELQIDITKLNKEK